MSHSGLSIYRKKRKMKSTFLKIFLLLCSLSILNGCSTVSEKLDIVGVIDKTEKWIFGNESEKEISEVDEKNVEKTTVSSETEEYFPDLDEIPQEKPTFDDLEKDFFEGEFVEKNQENVVERSLETSISEENTENKLLQTENNEINLIKNIFSSMRIKVRNLLLESDPPTDKSAKKISFENAEKPYDKTIKTNLVAIIQFPNNSIIPDNSAKEVIEYMVREHFQDNLKLVGHASSSGSNTRQGKKINMDISIARAEAIKKMLVDKGFESKKISIEGRGDNEPFKEEIEKFGDAANRRVEVYFISQ